MKKRRFGLSFLGVLIILMSMLTAFGGAALADESSQIKAARKGCFQFLQSYNYNGTKYSYSTSTAFLINENHIVTCYHCVSILDSGNNVVELGKYDGLSADDFTYEVVIKGDLKVEAEFVTGSAACDYAILKLDQPINDKTPLALADSAAMEDIDATKCYAVGFPGLADNNYQTQISIQGNNIVVGESGGEFAVYDEKELVVTGGTISKEYTNKGYQYLMHDATITNGSSGGPLLNESGQVIGVNESGITNSTNATYNSAVDIREVTNACDKLGIDYNGGSNSTQTPEEQLTSAIEKGNALLSGNYTEASLETLKQALEAGQKCLDDKTKDQYESAAAAITTAINGLEEKSGTNWLLIGGIGGGVVLIAVVVIILIASGNKKKKAGAAKADDYAFDQTVAGGNQVPPVPSPEPTCPPTGVLGGGAGATTILQEEQLPVAYLDRKATGQSAQITKSEFKIGKEKKNVDYCVADNSNISRFHATIIYKNGKFFIKDNNSTNKTYVNEGRISPGQEVELKNHDKIRLANEEFSFRG